MWLHAGAKRAALTNLPRYLHWAPLRLCVAKINNEWRVVTLMGQYFHNDRGTPQKAVFTIDEVGEKAEPPIIPDLQTLRRIVDANKAATKPDSAMASLDTSGSAASSIDGKYEPSAGTNKPTEKP